MLLTMIKEPEARDGFGEGIWERSVVKTVVLPAPVGRETPMRVMPARSAP